MIGLLFSAITAYSILSKVPGIVKKTKEAKKTNALEKLLSNQGSCDNITNANLENVYLSHDEFTKYFGDAKKAQGYIKSANTNSKHANFIDLESETCPILKYLWEESLFHANNLGGAPMTPNERKYFTLDRIKVGAKMLSLNNSDSMDPLLIEQKFGELIQKYELMGLIDKETVDSTQPESATNPAIYLLTDKVPVKLNKRYAVENNALKYFAQGDNLGNLNSNYSKLADAKITVMPISEKLAINISDDEKINEKVLEKVLLNSDNVMLNDGQIIKKDASNGWKVLVNYAGKMVLLAPEQYNNYVRINDKVLAEEEDEKKKKLMQGMQKATA